jgi:hypothetical protein
METNEPANSSNIQIQASNPSLNSQNIQGANMSNQMGINNQMPVQPLQQHQQQQQQQQQQYQQFQNQGKPPPVQQIIQQQQPLPIQSLNQSNFNSNINMQSNQTIAQSTDMFNQANKVSQSHQQQQQQPASNIILGSNGQPQINIGNAQMSAQSVVPSQANQSQIQPQVAISRASPLNPQVQQVQQVQPGPRPIQPINQQIIQSSTPPIIQLQTQQSHQQNMLQNFNQVGMQQNNGQTIVVNNPKPQAQIYNQQQQAPTLINQNIFSQQQNQTVIWDGNVEWQEKDRNNPNNTNKVTRIAKAHMISNIVLDQTTGQYIPEVSPILAQGWPQKIPLQLLSKQILDILTIQCTPPTRNLYLITDGNNLELRNTLQSIGVSHFFPL